MKTVYKYELHSGGGLISIPQGATILRASIQDGLPTIWAYVNTDQPNEDREFMIFGTGHNADSVEPEQHVATFFQGPYVWHLFETTKEKQNGM